MSKRMETMQLSNKVKLNVGGVLFTTTVQTLTKDPDSMLAAMFSGRFPMKPTEDGTFFIDRDGTYFRYILNYLRDGKLSLPEGATFFEEIEAEAEFYQIQGILEELGKPRPSKSADRGAKATEPFAESEILTQEHAKILQVIFKMNDRSQDEEALSQAQILANVERQINAATAAISEACKQLQQEADKLRNERETFDRMSKKIESTQISETVNLNIGGQHFTTTRQTLTKDPNSYFAAMFSGRFSLKRSEDGAIQTIEIDRDGKHFRHILNYLRDGKLSLPEEATCTDLEEIETEATYYQIQGIIDELTTALATRLFSDSKILTRELDMILSGMLPYKTGDWRLLYRASRDGFEAESFHLKCDYKGPTVTVVKTGNFVFGGFTEAAWRSPRK
ncbi:unnamed protein product [Porites evermanni]|uniref:BTB domain-containing protein n=1 Tax=Porites evermanni TaxID=104178 RepID=A0ABN8SSQ6_9CNID|nr:unnamed protein product [Porites evermanni]